MKILSKYIDSISLMQVIFFSFFGWGVLFCLFVCFFFGVGAVLKQIACLVNLKRRPITLLFLGFNESGNKTPLNLLLIIRSI